MLALGAIADALDRVAGQTVLRGYVRRVAAFDFRRRAPLARAYAQVLAGEALDARVRAELTTDHPSPDVADIVIGAMVQLDVAADHLEAFRELTRQIADPWFEILRAQTEADIDRRNGDWFGAETQLRNAQKQCGPAIHYRCLYLADDLGHLYQDLHRIPDALRVLQDGLRIARSSGEWGRYLALLLRTADAERFNSSIATARAYANELVLMAPSFRWRSAGTPLSRSASSQRSRSTIWMAARLAVSWSRRCTMRSRRSRMPTTSRTLPGSIPSLETSAGSRTG